MRKFTLLSILVIFALLAVACAPGVTTSVNDNGANTNDANANTNTNINTNDTNTNTNTNDTNTNDTNTNDTNANTNDTTDTGIPADDLPGTVGLPVFGASSAPMSTILSLMNLQILDLDGAEVGLVHDVLFNLDRPGLEYVVIQVGSGYKLVPFQAFTLQAGTEGSTQVVSLNINRADIESAPGIAEAELETGLFTAATAAYEFWSTRMDAEAASLAAQVDFENLMSAARLLPNGVSAAGIANLIGIQDIIFNTTTGELEYVVLEGGAQLNLQNVSIPVPFDAFTIDMQNGTLVLNIDPVQLANAPTINLNDLANISLGPDWEQGIQSFWESQ